MSQNGNIVKKLFLGAIFPIWRRERQRYEGAKLKFEKSTSKSIKLPIFKTFGKNFPSKKLPNDWTINQVSQINHQLQIPDEYN